MSNLTYDKLIEISRRVVSNKTNLEIKVCDFLPTETVQARRHKRKASRRWQKKWLKRFGTKQIGRDEIYRVGNLIIVSPEMHSKIMKQVQNSIENSIDEFSRKQFESLWLGKRENN